MLNSQRQNALKLYFLGFATLFLELILIRYLSGNIWNLGYFPNLVLLAVFFGMGVGFVFHQFVSDRVSPYLYQLGFVLLTGLIVYVDFFHPAVPGFGKWGGNVGDDFYFTATNLTEEQTSYWPFVLCFFLIISIFTLLSQRTAKVFKEFPPLTAYTLDILGSVSGIILFMAMSYFTVPAYVWLGLLAVVYALAASGAAWMRLAPLALGTLCALVAYHQDSQLLSDPEFEGKVNVFWSPYQKVEYVNEEDRPHQVLANGIEHQRMFGSQKLAHSFYQSAYEHRATQKDLTPYKRVLILGAGSGNDVATALLNNVEHVDAVEIDPVIARIGKAHHVQAPYSDPRVQLTVDDGRAFMTRAQGPYDLVIFALTDSVVKVSSMAQIRLENFLFTTEAVKRAYNLLSDQGDIVFYNYYREPWLLEKIEQMAFEATGRLPSRIYERKDFAVLKVGKYFEPAATAPHPDLVGVPHDDWPFLYLKTKQIPTLYWQAMGLVFLLIVGLFILVRRVTRREEKFSLPSVNMLKATFVLMGIAFLLLQTKSVIQFSLLFGTTWVNSSLVFLSVLTLILLANWTARGLANSTRTFAVLCVLLVSSTLITLIYPLGNLLHLESALLRFVFASVMTFSPIYFANVLFSLTFRDQKVAEHLFGWNLLGATLGGLVEYSSLALGYNQLSVIVAATYTLVFLTLWMSRRYAKQEASLPGSTMKVAAAR